MHGVALESAPAPVFALKSKVGRSKNLQLCYLHACVCALQYNVRRRSREAQDTLAEAMTLAGETIGATRTIQAFNAEKLARSRFTNAVDSSFRAARGAIRARAVLTGFAIAMAFGSVVGVLWYGAHAVLAGDLTPGTLGQFLLGKMQSHSNLF